MVNNSQQWSTIVEWPQLLPCAPPHWWGVRLRSRADYWPSPPFTPATPLFSTPFPLPLRSLSPIQNRRFPCFVLSFSSPWYVGICQPVHRIETELGLLSKWFKMEVKHPLYGLFKEAAGKWVRCLLSIPDHSPTLDGQKVLWRLAPQFLLSHKALRWDFRTGGPFPALPDHATSDTKITGQRKRRGWMNQDITSRKKGGRYIFLVHNSHLRLWEEVS